MPEIVLRHPNLPNQPVVIPVGDDGLVPAAYKAAGWQIDTKTDPLDAAGEAPKPKKAAAVKPSFEESATDTPAEPVNTNKE